MSAKNANHSMLQIFPFLAWKYSKSLYEEGKQYSQISTLKHFQITRDKLAE